ncbi:TRAP transporter small permease [Sedimentibacter sp.]|uniref:TRAP transporter small permease n=1 Tax=Sedimentibacter sp. TaxID=1960295 RepID=UPI0028985396|nr:TRAP transporter small permease [Sedimentibacter sp.]
MHVLDKISNGINKIMEYITIIMLAGIVVSLFAQVIFRFVFHTGLTWSEELSRYLHMWITFLGASIIFKEGKHLNLTFFIDILPTRFRKLIDIFNQLFLIFFLVLIIYHGIPLINIVKTQLTPAMEISTAWVYASLPIGAFFMLVQVIFRLKDRRHING